ncbi:TIGR03067 domain-containing protein [Tautonia plasticadhaerens]|uniref:Lipocalin-like domain-containing protein n=1 Tax=Tautonia plasticadhaerens TaxID=2527974 RepID=A0A518HAI5_9BACT|nr:TIGR03067 domain-containing protein [Tautonia plasticadhaerens]QDV37864.1 hypothetical protein ElP_58110 [Tautonia plasticadhaerens]
MLSLLLFTALTVVDEPKAGLGALEGEWVFQSLDYAGKRYSGEQDPGRRLAIAGYLVTQSFGDAEPMLSIISRFDASTDPGAIDLTRVEDLQTIPGIFTLEGDTLTLCTNSRGDRPTEFLAGPDSPNQLAVYTRAGP